MNDVKTCSVCGEIKLLVEFYSNKHAVDGCKSECKSCSIIAGKLWREKNKEKVLSNNRQYYIDNKEKVRTSQLARYTTMTLEKRFEQLIRNATARKKKQCFVTVEHLMDVWQKQNGLCAYTKLPLSSEAHQLNTVSLDRIDSDKDYTAENIQLVCVTVNYMKRDLAEDQFIQLCELVAQNVSKQTT